MLKEFLIVSTGSFFGGGARYVVSQWLQTLTLLPFPLGTFVVNVVGCLGRDGHFAWLALYIIGSLAVGFLCLLAGNSLAKALQ